MKSLRLFFAALSLYGGALFAQTTEVNYNILMDEPESINKLFIGFQPFYGEIWATNPTIGFGLEAMYFHEDKLHFHMNVRRPWGASFDMMRYHADANSSMDNNYKTHLFLEFGGAYHIIDKLEDKESTMLLYKKNTKRTKWAAQTAPTLTIPSKVRTFYTARLGGMIYQSTFDANRMIERQGLGYDEILSSEDAPIPTEYTNDLGDIEQVNMLSNMSVGGIYVGTSVTWARNIALEFDNYEPNIEDLIFTVYADLLLGLDINVDNLFYQDVEYSLSPLNTVPVGMRLGIDGRRNRQMGFGFGAEMGVRPGLKKGGFFGVIKIALPVFSSNLDEHLLKAYEAN